MDCTRHIYWLELLSTLNCLNHAAHTAKNQILLRTGCSNVVWLPVAKILFGIVTPDSGLIQAQQYCSILLTTRNNVSQTTLLHPVFNNLLQLVIFYRVSKEFKCCPKILYIIEEALSLTFSVSMP